MPAGHSDCSTPSDFRNNPEEYLRDDYWVHYDFDELIADIDCTTYRDYDQAHEIQCALQTAAEAEDIFWYDPVRLPSAIQIRYQYETAPVVVKLIRFKRE